MMKFTTIAFALSTAATLGIMPTATAQTDTAESGIPYEITFNGSLYPADLETVDYPYLAASQQRDGECTLKIISDDAGNIAGISIVTCTDDLFRGAATRYINAQNVSATLSSDLTAHDLKINWKIGMELEPLPLQIAAR